MTTAINEYIVSCPNITHTKKKKMFGKLLVKIHVEIYMFQKYNMNNNNNHDNPKVCELKKD